MPGPNKLMPGYSYATACYTEKQYKSFKTFNFKQANFEEFINELETLDWDQVLETLDANQAWEKFTDIFTNSVNSTIQL